MINKNSILNSFENGSFYNSNKGDSKIIYDSKVQLNDILIWANANLMPSILYDAQTADGDSLSKCLDLATNLQRVFSSIVQILQNTKPVAQASYNNIRGTHRGSGFWRDLQQNKNIDAAMYRTINETILNYNDEVPDISSATQGEVIAEDAAKNLIINKIIGNDKVPNILSPTQGSIISLNSNRAPFSCNECDCSKKDTFKFNFKIDYHPTLKLLLYGNKFLEVIEVNGINQSIIQFRSKNIFACLICNVEAGYKYFGNITEHIKGHKHKACKSVNILEAVSVYHKHFIRMEVSHQSHQIFFYPMDMVVTMCRLCHTYVQYEKLELHILSEAHKEHIIRLYQNDNNSILLKFQISVYKPALLDESNGLDDNFEVRPKQRLTANLDKSDSSESENEASSKLKQADDPHETILSVANPSGKFLDDVLEHRFLKHLNLFENIGSSNIVKCSCCNIVLQNLQLIRMHLGSKMHRINSKMPNIHWKYYCEVCDFCCFKNEIWFKHFMDSKHLDSVDKLDADKKPKLNEFQCNTCNLIFFGYDISLKNHAAIRKRKKKEIALSDQLKEALKTEKLLEEQVENLMAAANEVIADPQPTILCCKALEEALSDEFKKCKVYPFGSRVSGLGNIDSDLDVFVDVGDMYFGDYHQDVQSQQKFVKIASKIFRRKKSQFSDLNPIPTARTPIIQIFHKATNIDCDLSFRHGLSVENTKFLRFCIDVQTVTRPLILILKKWIIWCKLQENVNTYALSMLVIYFLQVKNYLLSVQELILLNSNVIIVDGWTITDFSVLHEIVKTKIKVCNTPMKQLLIEFFDFYKDFNYVEDVVCPLLGRPVKKSLFSDPDAKGLPDEMLPYIKKISKPNAELFRAKSHFCIQDPFDLSHNLAKAVSLGTVTKLITYCDLTSKYLTTS